MPFRSILFDEIAMGADVDGQRPPDFFRDLYLDQIVASITAGRDEYNLKPFFYIPLRSVAAIRYRQDILRDLDTQVRRAPIETFAQKMRSVRDALVQVEKSYYKYQKQSWLLSAVSLYCDAVKSLTSDLRVIVSPHSKGLTELCLYLEQYIGSVEFHALITETEGLRSDLSEIRYCLHIAVPRVTVSRYEAQPDYGAEVLQTFAKFKQAEPKNYRFELSASREMNHVEAAILDRVSILFPDIFSALEEYVVRHGSFVDHIIETFDREVQFYIAYLEHIDLYSPLGLPFCRPTVSDKSKEVCGHGVFDLALAINALSSKRDVITNDFRLKGPERILVVSGPNQGGKTTFARTFGQLHYLAALGCPVPGDEAQLFLFDNLFTHFEREENLTNLSGKLEDDLLRIHNILEHATSNSILIMNESFASTTLADALFLGKKMMQRIIELGMLCVSVTFLDEMASLDETTVSMVSTVNPEDTTRRTFKIIRRPADGLAYALALAEKYQLTYEQVKRRVLT